MTVYNFSTNFLTSKVHHPVFATKYIVTWYLANNKISDSGASTLHDYLPSLFPSLGCGYSEGVDLNKNPIIVER